MSGLSGRRHREDGDALPPLLPVPRRKLNLGTSSARNCRNGNFELIVTAKFKILPKSSVTHGAAWETF